MSDELSVIETPGGVTINARTALGIDREGVKMLIESGVSQADVARAYKCSPTFIKQIVREDDVATPHAVRRMRRELGKKQAENYRRSGKTLDLKAVKAGIWEQRGEELSERIYEISKDALAGVTKAHAKRMIQNPLGLQHMTNVVRQITGQEAEEAKAPQVAVNVALLQSHRPVPVDGPVVDA